MMRLARLSFSLCMALMVLVLAACGGTTGPSTTGGNQLSGSITFWMYQGDALGLKTMQELKMKFQQQHPGTTVNLVFIPKDNYIPKVTTAIATGTQPDVSYVDQPLIARYALDKVIDAVPASLIKEEDFFQGALNTNRVGGKLYGLPISQTCVALYYNKALVTTPPTTWDEMVALSKKVYNPDKQIAAVSFPRSGDYSAWIFPGIVAQAGGTMLDEANKKVTFAEKPGVEALTFWQELAKYSPTKITDSQNAFATGHVAMAISGPWEVKGFRTNFPDFKWGVSLLPKKNVDATNIGGENAAVYSKSKNKALAWEWLKYLTTKETNITLNDKVTGNFPITKDVSDPNNAWVKADDTRPVFLKQLQFAQPRPTVADWLKINDEIVGKALENALVKNQNAEQALKEGETKAKQILNW